MTFLQAIEYIHGTLKFGIKLGLENIRGLLDLMGNPHKSLKFVHVAGTNGKGSTVAFISSVLAESGYKVGIFTSPYIERFTERIRINDVEIPEEELSHITEFVKTKVDIMLEKGCNHPTEFEIITAIALMYFKRSKCDIVVLETGLGGRFDSTNVIDTPLVSVITTISYDHMDRLGDTLPKIAFEKAGIIKKDGDVVLYPQEDNVYKVFEDTCKNMGARLHNISFDNINIKEYSVDGQRFDYGNNKDIVISLLGVHQVKNSVVAFETLKVLQEKGFKMDYLSIMKGLKNAKWPGRMEVLRREPLFIVDGAHNREGAAVLAKNLKEYFPGKKMLFIAGILKDKDYVEIINTLLPMASTVVTVEPKSDRALDAKELAKYIDSCCINVHVSDTIEDAVNKVFSYATKDDIICAFGSLYLVGDIRRILTKC